MTAPDDDGPQPGEPADDRPPRLLSSGFWVMLAFGLVCILAGIFVATTLPRLLPPHPEAAERP